MKRIESDRRLIRSDLWRRFSELDTGERRKDPPPRLQKPVPPDAELLDLAPVERASIGRMPLAEAVERRRSRRSYSKIELTAGELSFLLWATQGITRVFPDVQATWRTVPSAGARHPFETYLLVNRVAGLAAGLYRYLPLEHRLWVIDRGADPAQRVHRACFKQYVRGSAATFIWTAIPARMEWRYGPLSAKLILLDAGHLCQNLYLAAESLGAGACAIGAYDQEAMDSILGVDGEEELTIYLATVGKLR